MRKLLRSRNSATLPGVRRNRDNRRVMRVGERVLVNKELKKEIMLVARVDIPHSTQKVFLSKSGGDFTVGLKIWKSDYVWNEKTQMWIARR